jgi:hypothetical protein
MPQVFRGGSHCRPCFLDLLTWNSGSDSHVDGRGNASEAAMTRRFMPVLLATAAAFSAAAPAWADYYILRESPAGPCRIVDDRPADGKSIVGGDRSYPDRTLAEKEMPLLCKSQ